MWVISAKGPKIIKKEIDNFAEMNELVSWVLNSMRSLDLEEVQERKREIDENGDGKVFFLEK